MENIVIEYLNVKKVDGIHETINRVGQGKQQDLESFKQINKDNYRALIVNEDNETITCSKLDIDNIEFFIPEFNPVHIYFSVAQENSEQSEQLRKHLKLEIKSIEGEDYSNYNLFISYIKKSTSGIVFLFSSIEAFINQQIPEDYEFRQETSKQTELRNKKQIERHCSFYDKVKIILPEIFENKKFHIDHPTEYQNLRSLKELRNRKKITFRFDFLFTFG